ncbi:MAG: DUF4367 domain-containing protein [Christensenellaceae bacterium]|nr:DUF4367 domain-containing protein [Christensenellaceae bacterium]
MTDRELKLQMRQALDMAMPPLPDDPDLTAKVLERYAKKQRVRRSMTVGLRVAAALIMVLLVMSSGVIARPYTYMDAHQSEDGEQYVLQGVSVTPSISQSADAALSIGWSELTTTDFDEAVETLGETPLIPVWLPEGWEIEDYYVLITKTQRELAVFGGQSPDGVTASNRMVYSTTTFDDIRDFYLSIEVNGEGKYVELENGLSIYVDMNVNRITSMWYDGLTGYSLSGDFSEEELLHIIRSMYGLD